MKKNLLLLLISIFVALSASAQNEKNTKVILKNKETLTGQIIEYKPGEYLKLLYLGNTIEIKQEEIVQIIFDVEKAQEVNSTPSAPVIQSESKKKELNRFYFESYNEVAIGLGMGKVNGYPFEDITGQLANTNVYTGVYSANGIGFNQMLFAGFGTGYYSHSGFGYDANEYESSYSIPFVIDLRYRVLPKYKISPLIMVAAGMSYYEGSIGTFTFKDGIGLSVKFNNNFSAQIMFAHNYERYSQSLSVNNGELENFYKGIYLNYAGPRIGVSFKI
jgi:hypothetical protein